MRCDHDDHPVQFGECGAPHTDCPSPMHGQCDREAGHDGSHHCNRCGSSF